jgi:hypothetical protein
MTYNRRWRYIIPCVLGQTIGQIWGPSVYPTTSNAGELALLIGITFNLFLVQKDLALAGSFADFLHRSNVAFSRPAGRRSSFFNAPVIDEAVKSNEDADEIAVGDIEMTVL